MSVTPEILAYAAAFGAACDGLVRIFDTTAAVTTIVDGAKSFLQKNDVKLTQITDIFGQLDVGIQQLLNDVVREQVDIRQTDKLFSLAFKLLETFSALEASLESNAPDHDYIIESQLRIAALLQNRLIVKLLMRDLKRGQPGYRDRLDLIHSASFKVVKHVMREVSDVSIQNTFSQDQARRLIRFGLGSADLLMAAAYAPAFALSLNTTPPEVIEVNKPIYSWMVAQELCQRLSTVIEAHGSPSEKLELVYLQCRLQVNVFEKAIQNSLASLDTCIKDTDRYAGFGLFVGPLKEAEHVYTWKTEDPDENVITNFRNALQCFVRTFVVCEPQNLFDARRCRIAAEYFRNWSAVFLSDTDFRELTTRLAAANLPNATEYDQSKLRNSASKPMVPSKYSLRFKKVRSYLESSSTGKETLRKLRTEFRTSAKKIPYLAKKTIVDTSFDWNREWKTTFCVSENKKNTNATIYLPAGKRRASLDVLSQHAAKAALQRLRELQKTYAGAEWTSIRSLPEPVAAFRKDFSFGDSLLRLSPTTLGLPAEISDEEVFSAARESIHEPRSVFTVQGLRFAVRTITSGLNTTAKRSKVSLHAKQSDVLQNLDVLEMFNDIKFTASSGGQVTATVRDQPSGENVYFVLRTYGAPKSAKRAFDRFRESGTKSLAKTAVPSSSKASTSVSRIKNYRSSL